MRRRNKAAVQHFSYHILDCGNRKEDVSVLQIAFFVLGISICIFAWIMIHDPRTLWSGITLLWTLFCLAVTLFLLVQEYADWLAEHDFFMYILVAMLLMTMGAVLAFPLALIVTLFIEGIKVIRHEGLKPANLLTLLFSVLLSFYLIVWPAIGHLEKGRLGTSFYMFTSLFVFYMLLLMTVYLLSAALNLFHLRKHRNADYIIVLGAGVIGTRIPPLLAARIDGGLTCCIAIQRHY